MPCDPEELKHVPLFALLDNDEIAVLAAQVDLKAFASRQRIYKIGGALLSLKEMEYFGRPQQGGMPRDRRAPVMPCDDRLRHA